MPAKKKRTRIARKKSDPHKLSIREITESKDGYSWTTFLVQGWKEDGKWQRKRFKDRGEAERFVAKKQVEILNNTPLHNVTTKLSPEQVAEAEVAFSRLGERYTLDDAVSYFLNNFAEPAEHVSIEEAIASFIDAREKEGIKGRTLIQFYSTLGHRRSGERKKQAEGFRQFAERKGAVHVHEISAELVEGWLRSLRGKDGVSTASRQTWNNRRAELHAFFEWAADKRRRWIAENPVSHVHRFEKRQIEKGPPVVLSPKDASDLMEYVARYKGGILARYFALALFAGIRPEGELKSLARHRDRDRLIDLEGEEIYLPAEIVKTGEPRMVKIQPNLHKWLVSFPVEILPKSFDRDIKAIRKKFDLGHDVLRHTFLTAHVGAFGSMAEAALEAGNSEAVIRKHYLNAKARRDGPRYWEIIPPSDVEEKIIHLAS